MIDFIRVFVLLLALFWSVRSALKAVLILAGAKHIKLTNLDAGEIAFAWAIFYYLA